VEVIKGAKIDVGGSHQNSIEEGGGRIHQSRLGPHFVGLAVHQRNVDEKMGGAHADIVVVLARACTRGATS